MGHLKNTGLLIERWQSSLLHDIGWNYQKSAMPSKFNFLNICIWNNCTIFQNLAKCTILLQTTQIPDDDENNVAKWCQLWDTAKKNLTFFGCK